MIVYTVKEAAEVLKICEVKVYDLVREKQIKPTCRIGKKILIPEVALNAFLLNIDLDVNSELLKSLSS